MTLRALAPGKVNLCLFVGAPRPDGLHPLVSIVQPVALADELTLSPAPPGARADEVDCPGVVGENLAARALAAYRAATGWDAPPQRLEIAKRVPVAAGMGGGSSDAATALRLAARAAGRPGDPVIRELAPRLGADVPALLEPRRALMTGAGEHVEPLPAPEAFGLVLVPAAAAQLATRDVYAELDRQGLGRSTPELERLVAEVRAAAIRGGPLPRSLLVNDLERPARSLLPEIDARLQALRAAGAAHALVAGSGPTAFGLFPGRDGIERARRAAAALAARHPGTVATQPVK